MTVLQLKEILSAELLCGGDHLDREVQTACGSDMMSDVLAFVKEQAVLLTGLVNPQVVRTAEMMDMKVIVFVRGKVPGDAILDLARELDIVVLKTELEMFTSCGKLYQAGLRGGRAVDKVRALGFGAGMGLPNIKKYTDEMKIDTEKDVGTTISLKVYTAH